MASLMVPRVRVRRVRGLDRAAEDRASTTSPSSSTTCTWPRRGWSDVTELSWVREDDPVWDADKRRVIGGAPDGAFVIPFRDGEPLAGRVVVGTRGRPGRQRPGLRPARHRLGWRRPDPARGRADPSGARGSAASCWLGSRTRPRRAASTTSTTRSASTSSATWCTTGWWSVASAARWTATCASGSAARRRRPARSPRASVTPYDVTADPGGQRSGPRGAGRVRRRGRAPLLTGPPLRAAARPRP